MTVTGCPDWPYEFEYEEVSTPPNLFQHCSMPNMKSSSKNHCKKRKCRRGSSPNGSESSDSSDSDSSSSPGAQSSSDDTPKGSPHRKFQRFRPVYQPPPPEHNQPSRRRSSSYVELRGFDQFIKASSGRLKAVSNLRNETTADANAPRPQTTFSLSFIQCVNSQIFLLRSIGDISDTALP